MPSTTFSSRLLAAASAALLVLPWTSSRAADPASGNSGPSGANVTSGGAAATPSPTPTPAVKPGEARFQNYNSPQGVGDDSGEPSIGSDWTTEKKFSNSGASIPNGGTTLYFGGFSPSLLRITFNDCSSPAHALWEEKPLLTASTPRAAGDPILYTDSDTGRTFVSQLEGLTPAGSTTDITDDDGETFIPSEGSDLPSDVDHQTFGGGPFHAPLQGGVGIYPNAVYYASQSVAEARAAISLDGGITFNAGSPMYTIDQCAGLHGHIKVGPDGTAYVPNKACGGSLPYHEGGQPSVVVSEDNGTTWDVRPVPKGTSKGDDDAAVGVTSDPNTIYLGWQSADGHPRTSVSHDKGKTWADPYDVGAMVNVKNTTFPAMVAGDKDRAVFAFYGTETGGDNYDQPEFPGVWYLYIATTYDGGATWTTVNATPNDPVQRGGICGSGTCRNLLDFFDVRLDKEGRILVGWDDGCIGGCVDGGSNSFSSKAVITRQSGGKRMFAAFDPAEPAKAGAPAIDGGIDAGKTKVTLTWQVPDNGGAPITGYNIYRRAGAAGSFQKIGSTATTTFVDTTFNKNVTNTYHVTAVNSQGEGPFCEDFVPKLGGLVESPCKLPGVLAVTDLNADGSDNDSGQNTPPDPSLNVRNLFVAEPFVGTGINELVFTMELGKNGTLPPNSELYIIWQRIHPDADFDRFYVAMRSDVTGTISYEYGKFGVPLDTSGGGVPNPNSNTPQKLGNVDKGTFDAASGLLTITLSTAKAEGIQPGQSLNGLNVRTFAGQPDQDPRGPRNQAIARDITNDGSYTLAGNASCVPNDQAPIAALKATPKEGAAPLKVAFDATASTDPDAGDKVAKYRFSFGDGTPAQVQTGPTANHTYQLPGIYFATLKVIDSKGLESTNIASVVIQTSATLSNISTRARVDRGDDATIGGFIIDGNSPKKVIIRGLGPSLKSGDNPFPGRLADPTLELYDASKQIEFNDNWKEHQAEVEATGIPPKNDKEAAIVRTLAPGSYTAILRGKNNGTGTGLIEVYDLERKSPTRLANLSTRGRVETGENVMIGGFMVGPSSAGPARIVVRALGPSLDVPDALQDPTVDVRNANGDQVAFNDNWQQTQKSAIEKTGLAPTRDKESAILLPAVEPGSYTAVVRGKSGVGVGLVEVYNLQ